MRGVSPKPGDSEHCIYFQKVIVLLKKWNEMIKFDQDFLIKSFLKFT